MRIIFVIVLLIFPFYCAAQCPEGDVVLNTQADVDAFVNTYPNCTEIDGNLFIELAESENQILDLTGLIGLEAISGVLAIENLHYGNLESGNLVPGSIEGLNNLSSVGSLFIGGNLSFNSVQYLESLDPLSNVQGEIYRLRIAYTVFSDGELPNFDGIVSAEKIELRGIDGVNETPSFPNLTSLSQFIVIGSWWEEEPFSSVHIPSQIDSIYSPDNSFYSELVILNNRSLTQITGADELEYSNAVYIVSNESLENTDVFDNLESAGDINLSSCSAGTFSGFKNLQSARQLIIEVGSNENSTCEVVDDLIVVRVSENTSDYSVGIGGVYLSFEGVDNVLFTGNLRKTPFLRLSAVNVESISGFSSLDSIAGASNTQGLRIGPYTSATLPDFTNLSHINDEFRLFLNSPGTSLLNLEGMNSLRSCGRIRIRGSEELSTPLVSLEGLNMLDSVEVEIELRELPNLADISAIESLRYMGSLQLWNTPALTSTPVFSELEAMNFLELRETGVNSSVDIPLIDSLTMYRLTDNSELSTLDVNPQLLHISNVIVDGNTNLTSIEGNTILEVNEITIMNNLSLQNCGASETICQMISTATEIEINSNGLDCSSETSVSNQCQFLGTEEFESADVKVWLDHSHHLNIQSAFPNQVDMRLYDITGKLMLSKNDLELVGTISVSLPSLSSGIYMVNLQSGGLRSSHKILMH